MMTIAFDLISDLHLDNEPTFNWSNQATSPFCIVAGDVASNHKILRQALTDLGNNYQAVFYIDGNDEHRSNYEALEQSYQDVGKLLHGIKNVTYLHDRVAVIDDTAILAVNGWWSHDYDAKWSSDETKQRVADWYGCSREAVDNMHAVALSDAAYLDRSIAKLQRHVDVKKIIVVSHSVPLPRFFQHDKDLVNTYRMNTTSNIHMIKSLANDTQRKVTTWCFGHYHWAVDETVDGIRYVCNPRGRSGTPWYRTPYFPQRIEA